MRKGTTVGFIVAVAGVLLTTMPSVYANHVATGSEAYAVPRLGLSRFQFVVAREDPTNFVQSAMAGGGGPMSFQTFMISTAIVSFTIVDEPDETRKVTITGELESTTVLGVGPDLLPFTELVPFTAIGVDKAISGGADRFSLAVAYSANSAQGELFESLGFGTCTATCTMTFEGPVTRGDIFVHTSGGD